MLKWGLFLANWTTDTRKQKISTAGDENFLLSGSHRNHPKHTRRRIDSGRCRLHFLLCRILIRTISPQSQSARNFPQWTNTFSSQSSALLRIRISNNFGIGRIIQLFKAYTSPCFLLLVPLSSSPGPGKEDKIVTPFHTFQRGDRRSFAFTSHFAGQSNTHQGPQEKPVGRRRRFLSPQGGILKTHGWHQNGNNRNDDPPPTVSTSAHTR